MDNVRNRKQFDINNLIENNILEKSMSAQLQNPYESGRGSKRFEGKKGKRKSKSIPAEYYHLAYRV